MAPFDHVSSKDLEIDGARIYYEMAGADRGPALVLMHGGLGTLEEFNALLPLLPDDLHIVGIDSRGHGRSTLGDLPLSYERLAEDAWRVITHLQLPDVSLLGFSDGGIAAFRLAARKATGIRRLVTVGARPALRPDTATRFAQITAESWQAKFPATWETYRRTNPAPDFDRLVGAVVAMWLDPSPAGYPLDRLPAITCPSLIVRGDDDHLLRREDALECATRISGAKFSNIPFAGHAALADQPEVFTLGLRSFLRST